MKGHDAPIMSMACDLNINSKCTTSIDVDLSVSEEVEAVSVAMGKHLLLPCETGAVNPPTQSTWMKDGVEVTGNEVSMH